MKASERSAPGTLLSSAPQLIASVAAVRLSGPSSETLPIALVPTRRVVDDADGEAVGGDVAVAVARGEAEGERQHVFLAGAGAVHRMIEHAVEVEGVGAGALCPTASP